MEDRYRAFGQQFSAAIVAKDYAAARTLLAPWLQSTTATLRDTVERRVREMCEEWGLEEAVDPAGCDLDGNASIKVSHLREPEWDDSIPDVPSEVSDANFRYWMSLQFTPPADAVEFDAFFDLWVAVVEDEGALRVGYYKFTDPD